MISYENTQWACRTTGGSKESKHLLYNSNTIIIISCFLGHFFLAVRVWDG